MSSYVIFSHHGTDTTKTLIEKLDRTRRAVVVHASAFLTGMWSCRDPLPWPLTFISGETYRASRTASQLRFRCCKQSLFHCLATCGGSLFFFVQIPNSIGISFIIFVNIKDNLDLLIWKICTRLHADCHKFSLQGPTTHPLGAHRCRFRPHQCAHYFSKAVVAYTHLLTSSRPVLPNHPQHRHTAKSIQTVIV